MNIILFDSPEIHLSLLPLAFTRPVADIRCGILTIAEKWSHLLQHPVSYCTADYLQKKYPCHIGDDNLLINGAALPDDGFLKAINALQTGQGLQLNGMPTAIRLDKPSAEKFVSSEFDPRMVTLIEQPARLLRNTWDIFHLNAEQIKADFKLLTFGRESYPLADPNTIVYGRENIFLEEGAKIKAAILNAENGPIYLGKNSELQEGAIIRGPFALGESAVISLGAKIRGDSTVGPHCKVGGEVSNSILFGYSNKGHDGYLGNSIIGEWCNLGADTNTSNLKNNYKTIKLWNYAKGGFIDSGLQFCGLTMGDHSKCGINTMFNTGTVVGISANIFGPGYPGTFVPSFSWGGASGYSVYDFDKAIEVAAHVMQRKGRELGGADRDILRHIFEFSAKYRAQEKN